MMFLLTPIGVIGFEESAIIYNSTTVEEQQIALGIRKEGQMGSRSGNIAENASDTGIAYKFDGSYSQGYKSDWSMIGGFILGSFVTVGIVYSIDKITTQ